MPQTSQPPRRNRAVTRGVALAPDRVRELRIKLGKAQVELAVAADVSVDTVGRAENGTPISLESATAIASMLQVELSVLMAADNRASERSDRPSAQSNIPEGMVPRVFRGREEALAAIETALAAGGGRAAVTALHGLRGVGKTVLAAAFAERHAGDYRAAWWVHAETEAGLRADLAGLAVRLQWAAADAAEADAVEAAGEGLRRDGGGILVVFDNARDPNALEPFLPRGGGAHVIVTSNAPNWGRVATPVPIAVWPAATGGDFLLARCSRPAAERSAAEALSAALGGLPLAHEMAASYCERTGLSFAGYRERLAAQAPLLLDSGDDAPDEYHDRQTVAKAFALAIEEAARDNPAAETLISLLALLPPEPIPRFLFSEGMGELFTDRLDAAVASLRDVALIDCEAVPDERDPNFTTDTLRLHRLVREVAASRLDDTARKTMQRILIAAMAKVYPRRVYSDARTWPRTRRLNAPALALLDALTSTPDAAEPAAASLMNGLAGYQLSALVAHGEAEMLLRRALAIAEAHFGLEHPNVAFHINNLALLLQSTGRPAEAEPLLLRTLAIDEKHFGADHPAIATALSNLASLRQDTSRPGEAEPFFLRALAIDEKHYGVDHPEVAIDLNNLAEFLRAAGRPGEAEPLYRRAQAIFDAHLGSDHPYAALCLSNLALLFRDTGRLEAAEPLFRRALAIFEASLGPEHPHAVTARENLAVLLGGGA